MKLFVWLFAILTLVPCSLAIALTDPDTQVVHKIRIRVEEPSVGHENHQAEARNIKELREFLQSHCVYGTVRLGYITQGNDMEPYYEYDAVDVSSPDDKHFKWLIEKTDAGESRFIRADQFDQYGKCRD